jgi:anti-sigma B factor antagonist
MWTGGTEPGMASLASGRSDSPTLSGAAAQSLLGVRLVDHGPATGSIAASQLRRGVGKASGLNIRIEYRDGTSLMVLSGELDMATAPFFEESVASAQSDHAAVVVDLQEVTFMDSTGLHILLDATSRAVDRGGRFHIVNCRAQVRRLVELTRTEFLLGDEEALTLPH